MCSLPLSSNADPVILPNGSLNHIDHSIAFVAWPIMRVHWAHIVLVCSAVKLLLLPAYRSTDFEVHRNWLAITHSLPLSKWYTDETSQWTLDYPPFFAWFEWALSLAARLVDPAMLVVSNLEYASYKTVVFQRCTVIVTELLLLAAAWYSTRQSRRELRLLALFLVAAHPGLIIVDHIHFQYNGVLLGLFMLSLACVAEGRDLAGGVLFAVLLNMKHIFLYAAPVYFVHLLRHYCRGPGAVGRFLKLGLAVVAVFVVSLGPFIALGQLPQVLRRLFPFARGLCHAYWAPNVWALYAAADKALSWLLPRLGVPIAAPTARMTGGLVGVAEFTVLPQVGSGATALGVLASMTPCLVATWRNPHPQRFPAAVLYATMCSFMLGYHVHEKAILMVVVPMAVLGVGVQGSPSAARDYLFLSTLATYSLFPLLFVRDDYPIKVLLLLLYAFLSSALFRDLIMPPASKAANDARAPQAARASLSSEPAAVAPMEDGAIGGGIGLGGSGGARGVLIDGDKGQQEQGGPVLWRYERMYLYGLAGVELFSTALHPLLLGEQLPFLPLMLISVYCALGMLYAWTRMAAQCIGASAQAHPAAKGA